MSVGIEKGCVVSPSSIMRTIFELCFGVFWGYFNAVICQAERKGVEVGEHGSSLVESLEFGAFIEEMRLLDLPLLDRRFSRFYSNGVSMSRLDRVLISLV